MSGETGRAGHGCGNVRIRYFPGMVHGNFHDAALAGEPLQDGHVIVVSGVGVVRHGITYLFVFLEMTTSMWIPVVSISSIIHTGGTKGISISSWAVTGHSLLDPTYASETRADGRRDLVRHPQLRVRQEEFQRKAPRMHREDPRHL